MPGRRAGFSELRILGEEAVARMDALRASAPRDLDQLLDDQIAFARGRRADQVRLIGDTRVQRAGVGLRIDRDDAQAEALCGARDANGDLAAIGDQDGREHDNVLPQSRTKRHSASRECLQAEIIAWRPD